jgi:hypothetical protein
MANPSDPRPDGEPGPKKKSSLFPAYLSDAEFHQLLYRLTRGQPADREDIVQQVLLKLTEWCADETERSPEEMRKYGTGILKKLLALHARKTGKAKERASDTSPEDHAAREHPAKMDRVDVDRVRVSPMAITQTGASRSPSSRDGDRSEATCFSWGRSWRRWSRG